MKKSRRKATRSRSFESPRRPGCGLWELLLGLPMTTVILKPSTEEAPPCRSNLQRASPLLHLHFGPSPRRNLLPICLVNFYLFYFYLSYLLLSQGRKNSCCPPRPLPDQEYPCSCAQWMEQPGRGGPPGGAAATTTPLSVGMQKVQTYDRPPQTKKPSSRGPRPHPKGKPPTSGKSQGRSTREGRGGHEQRKGRSGPRSQGATQPRDGQGKQLQDSGPLRSGPPQTPAPDNSTPEPGLRTPRREILVQRPLRERDLPRLRSASSNSHAPSRGPTRTVQILEPPLGVTEEPLGAPRAPAPRTQNLLEELNETLALKGISLEDNQPGDFCSDSLWLRSS
jgi:hypothetical protein